jgi:predicted transposase YdaD
MQHMDERVVREVAPSRIGEYRAATRFLLGLRYDEEQILAWMQGMSWVRESSLWRIAVDEGRQEGREEGREVGRLEEARQLVLEFGAERLGPPDQYARSIIERLDDHEQLKRLIRDSLTATSWQELLADAPER